MKYRENGEHTSSTIIPFLLWYSHRADRKIRQWLGEEHHSNISLSDPHRSWNRTQIQRLAGPYIIYNRAIPTIAVRQPDIKSLTAWRLLLCILIHTKVYFSVSLVLSNLAHFWHLVRSDLLSLQTADDLGITTTAEFAFQTDLTLSSQPPSSTTLKVLLTCAHLC